MLWMVLAFLTALASASQDAWIKRFFAHLNAYEMLVFPMLYSLPLFVITAFLIPIPTLDGTYLWCLLIGLPLNAACSLLYMQAIKIAPLSLTLPYMAFTPVFMLLTGFLVLGEIPNMWGGVGILTTCLGGYVLNIDPHNRRFGAPLRALLNETGSWIMLLVALLFSFAAVIGKKGIQHSSPLFFVISHFAIMNLGLTVFLLVKGKVRWSTFTKEPYKGTLVGALLFLHAVFHGLAISMTMAVYMIAIKRISILIGVIYGHLLFKEGQIVIRYAGAFLMLTGAMIILVKG